MTGEPGKRNAEDGQGRAANEMHQGRAAGISPATLTNWKQRGADGERPFVKFIAAIEKAESQCERTLVQRVIQAAKGPSVTRTERTVKLPSGKTRHETTTESKPGDWHAAAWLLERRFPEQFGRPECRRIAGTAAIEGDAEPREVRVIFVAPDGTETESTV